MSLLVWLPMTKDLTQQGLSDITVSNTGVTLNNNGKLGKCYYFDGNAHYLEFSKSVGDLYSGDFSYAVWLKPTDDTRSIICSEYPATGASGIAFELSAARGIRLYWNGSPDIYPSNCTLTKNEWSHVAITRSGNEAKFYINGELRYTYTGTLSNKTSTAKIRLGDDYRGGTSVSYQGYMNDFRLYNHCLAPKEIEILSRGLVCHYPLNGGGRGGDNLLVNTSDLTKWTKESGITTTWDSEKNMYKIEDSTHTNSRWGIYQDINVEANTSYTITVTLDGTACGAGFAVYDSSTSFPPAVISTTGRQSYTLTSGANSTKARIYLYTNCGVSNVAWFSLPKVEKSDHTTPWIPNPADSAYTAMGYNSTTEYDVSGYGNNMTKTGTITYTTDSIRYNVTSHFINGSYLMANQNCGEYLPKDSLTVNIWVKPTTWSNPISCTEGGGWNIEESGSGLQFQCYISGVGYKPAKCSVTGSSLVDSKWHMLTGVFDRAAQQTKFYIDGELKATGSTGSTNGVGYASNRLIISGEAQSTTPASSAFVGEESDVRIYATALSATQVAELYNTAVSVANNGTLMGYELVEG